MKVETKRKKLAERVQRKVAHKEFVKSNKRLFLAMDICIILMVLANFGAVLITNALVVKATPDVQFKEANPVQAELNDYEQHPEGKAIMNMFMIQSLLWGLVLTGYLYMRLNIYTTKDLWFTILILIFYMYFINYDFFNDLGLYIGKVFYG